MRKKLILLMFFVAIIFSLSSCFNSNNDDNKKDEKTSLSFNGSDLKVGQSSKIIGNTERNIPIELNEGNRYPTFGTSLSNITEDEKANLISESNYLKASDTTYNRMDKYGNLYLNDTKLDRKLYKHTTASNNYYGTVSDGQKAVIKELHYNARSTGNHITGLYAPAGEVIAITLSDEDLKKTGGVNIEMGQYSQNNQLNNIWQARNDFNRMPLLGNEMLAEKNVTYVGTFLGGPIYVTPKKSCEFTITISGAVEYAHFIYGLTTKEEFNRLKDSSAPYFDLEVWDSCVRHSGPKKFANLDYENLNKISEFWIAVSNISKQIPTGSSSAIGITFLYDPFIAAGGAVAFVGRNWCNLPPDWMTSSLSYDNFTTSGNWGTIHEFNHHFQRYGFAPGDEVTNNAISILSYISYTKISEFRDKLSGWNRYLNPQISLNETLNQSSSSTSAISSLNAYVDIIHAFGVDTFINAAKYKNGSGGVDNWYESLCEATGYNMAYYFSLLHQEVSSNLKDKYKDYKMFIPATLNEQTGKVVDGNEIITVLPYVVNPNEDYSLDLDKSLTIPSGFSYKLLDVKAIDNTTVNVNNNIIKISTNNSSKIEITIKLENKELNYTDTQTFIVELKPEYQGINYEKYTYSTRLYNTAKEALEANFEGYEALDSSIISKHFINGVTSNQIATYYGKIYINQDGKYKISVRTSNRSDTLLELGLNSVKYTDLIDSPRTNPIDLNKAYIEYNVKKGDYIYFRVTINSYHSDGFAELYGGFDQLKSIDSSYLYNNESYKTSYTLVDKYPRSYTSEVFTIPYTNQKIVSYTEAYSNWDENYKIENIIDGDPSTSYHSVKDKLITSEPFELTIDLGKAYYVNTLNITTYNGSQAHYPMTFKLYGGLDLNNLVELQDVSNPTVSNRLLSVSFNATNIRYYKLVITDTSNHRYVAMTDINMSLNTKGTLVSPKNANYYVSNNENFSLEHTYSTFGYLITGNGEIKITASKTFGIIINDNNAKLSITIDGKESIVEFDKIYYLELDNPNKEITIKVLSSSITITSFII